MRLESLTEQLTDLKKKLKQMNGGVGEAPAAAEEVPLPVAADVLTAIDDALQEIETYRNELKRPPPAMSYRQRPRLREEIRSLMFAINGATARPTTPQLGRLTELQKETTQAVNAYNRLVTTRIATINEMVREVPQVVVGSGG